MLLKQCKELTIEYEGERIVMN